MSTCLATHQHGQSTALPMSAAPGAIEVAESVELIGARLRKAIRDGDLQRCRALVVAGADLAATDEAGWTPLHVAALEERPEITRLLVESGAPIEAPCGKGRWRALHIAVSYASVRIAALWWRRRPSHAVASADRRGKTADRDQKR